MNEGRRIPNEVHLSRPWRATAIAPDFDLLDVWQLPITGGADELPALLATFEKMTPDTDAGSGAASFLFRLRAWLGDKLGWDRDVNVLPIPGCTETSVRDRLDPELRAPREGGDGKALAFAPVYRGEDEAISELSNDTVHALMQVCWIDEGDHHRARMAVYVKPRGRLGRVYMALIAPFRHWIVYPALMRRLGALWHARATS